MIQAMIFDMDGTLVQTERLKARSYACAAVELRPELEEEAVAAAYEALVGRSRQEVAEGLLQRFDLAAAARERAGDGEAPWEAYVGVRLRYYDAMLADGALIRSHRRGCALELLETARRNLCRVALATTSSRAHATAVLEALGLASAFDAVITAGDVRRTKPHPEAYRLAAVRVRVPPGRCLAVEDSVAGVRAALAAGVHVVAAATDLTRAALHEANLLDDMWIVDDTRDLPRVAQARIDAEAGR